jgi:hypothetical protein
MLRQVEVIWTLFNGVSDYLHNCRTLDILLAPVIEDCGAMPDLEDREGEVYLILSFTS